MILIQSVLLILLNREGWGHSMVPHLTAPGTWRVGVPELVSVHTFQQSEDFPVTISLLSYPDKKTTFSTALLQLTPENGFQGAVELVVALADFPGEFVYLVAESEVFREERRITVSGATRSKRDEADVKRRRQSLLSIHEEQTMISRYQRPSLQRCCLNGSDYYTQTLDCRHNTGLRQSLRAATAQCRKAAEECCAFTENHMYKNLPMAKQEITREIWEKEPEPITITITVRQISAGGTATFTVKTDPTQDVSVHVSSTMAAKVHVWFGRAPSEDGRMMGGVVITP